MKNNLVSRRSKAPLLLVASVAILSGCATQRPTEMPESRPEVLGIASVYANELRGRLTADGDRYNPDALTAASLQFPLGTRVRVENVANGKHVVVRINDRGPYEPGRMGCCRFRGHDFKLLKLPRTVPD